MKTVIFSFIAALLLSGCSLKVLPYGGEFSCGGDPKKLGKCSNAIDNLVYAEDMAAGEQSESDEIYDLTRKLIENR